MTDADLQLFEISLARDSSFEAMREPSGVAWVSASTEQQARQLVQARLGDVHVAEVENYGVAPARVIAVQLPR